MTVAREGPFELQPPWPTVAPSGDGERPTRQGHFAYLAVDDDQAVLAAHDLDLADTYTLHLANTGARAVQFLGRHPIDFVLLDLKLPDLNGIELLRRVRAAGTTPASGKARGLGLTLAEKFVELQL